MINVHHDLDEVTFTLTTSTHGAVSNQMQISYKTSDPVFLRAVRDQLNNAIYWAENKLETP